MMLTALFCVYYAVQLLAIRHFKVRSNRILAFFFVPIFFLELFSFSTETDLDLGPQLVFLFMPMAFLWGPTLFLYIKSFSSVEGLQLTWRKDLRHYLPAVIALVINIPLMVVIIVLGKTSALYAPAAHIMKPVTLASLFVLWPLQNLIYIILSYRLWRKHKRTFVEFFSFEEGINLRWMRNTIVVYALFIVGIAAASVIDYEHKDVIFHATVLLYVIYVGYNGTRQIDVYYGLLNSGQRQAAAAQHIPKRVGTAPLAPAKIKHVATEALPPIPPAREAPDAPPDKANQSAPAKYSGSSLRDAERVAAIKTQLLEFMESEKPYLNVALTIFDIAKELDINNKYISQVINQDLGVNFISFINGYRVEEAQKLLLDPTKGNYTIEGLAEMAGFKSKSTFNTAFKKITGKTPSQYRKEQLAMA